MTIKKVLFLIVIIMFPLTFCVAGMDKTMMDEIKGTRGTDKAGKVTTSKQSGLRGVTHETFGALGSEKTFRSEVVGRIGVYIGAISILIGTIALCFIIYAGFLWITAKGNAEQAKQGQKILTNSVIAILIVGFAYMITAVATQVLTESLIK